jgi:hypothetical protein
MLFFQQTQEDVTTAGLAFGGRALGHKITIPDSEWAVLADAGNQHRVSLLPQARMFLELRKSLRVHMPLGRQSLNDLGSLAGQCFFLALSEKYAKGATDIFFEISLAHNVLSVRRGAMGSRTEPIVQATDSVSEEVS